MLLKCGQMTLNLSPTGELEEILIDSKNYLIDKSSFVKIVVNDIVFKPINFKNNNDILTFIFENKIELQIKMIEEGLYTSFEVIFAPDEVDLILWGPYPISFKGVIGEIIGVLRQDDYAIGLQCLNMKTLGGWPKDFIEFGYDKNNVSVLQLSVDGYKYSMVPAAPITGGAVLQAYCRNRTKTRKGTFINTEIEKVPPIYEDDANIIGSKISLYCCNTQNILDVIENIEIKEGLPHPTIDGEWVKKSRKAMSSYLISDFSESNIDGIIEYAKKAGFEYIYHPEPFETWGNFVLRKDRFPDGDQSLLNCSKKCEAHKIKVGLHTLTTFTTTNDAYVTEIPDKRLAKAGYSNLLENISEADKDIKIANGKYFKEQGYLSTIVVGDELIQYKSIDIFEDYAIIKDCLRGAFKTKASSHFKGDEVAKLLDHAYKVFFPELSLQDKYRERLSQLFEYANLSQVSFDGLEGIYSTGEEDYAINRFVNDFFENHNGELINDSSGLNHFTWHVQTRTNWGEPWGEEMRAGQIEVRIINQKMYHNNLFPRMLGWFLVRTATKKFRASTLEDIEWALAKAAGFDAGFSLCIDPLVFKNLGNIEQILHKVKLWEKARFENVFSEELKQQLKKPETEWCINESDEKLILCEMKISKTFTCDAEEFQPGQPGGADWTFSNPFSEQPVYIRLQAVGSGSVINPCFVIQGVRLAFELSISSGEYLIYDARNKNAYTTDKNFNKISETKPSSENVTFKSGDQSVSFACEFSDIEDSEAKVTFMSYGEEIYI